MLWISWTTRNPNLGSPDFDAFLNQVCFSIQDECSKCGPLYFTLRFHSGIARPHPSLLKRWTWNLAPPPEDNLHKPLFCWSRHYWHLHTYYTNTYCSQIFNRYLIYTYVYLYLYLHTSIPPPLSSVRCVYYTLKKFQEATIGPPIYRETPVSRHTFSYISFSYFTWFFFYIFPDFLAILILLSSNNSLENLCHLQPQLPNGSCLPSLIFPFIFYLPKQNKQTMHPTGFFFISSQTSLIFSSCCHLTTSLPFSSFTFPDAPCWIFLLYIDSQTSLLFLSFFHRTTIFLSRVKLNYKVLTSASESGFPFYLFLLTVAYFVSVCSSLCSC